jgi:hypothetical protein
MSVRTSYNGCNLLGGEFWFNDENGALKGADRAWVKDNINPSDGGLYYDLADKTGCFASGGPVLATSFDAAMRSVTGGAYGVGMVMYTSRDITNRLRSSGLPLVWWVELTHYCTIIGGDVQTSTYHLGPFSWVTSQNSWILIYDNGTLIKNNGMRPVWRKVDSGLAWFFVYPMQ